MKILGIILLLALASLAFADSIPTLYPVQGRITNATTNATIQGTFTANFSIYTNLTGTSPIWNNVTTITTDINGIYNYNLNITNLSFNQPYYLGTAIGADPEWSPRMLMGTVAFANRANITDHLNPNLTISFTNITGFPSSTPTCGAGTVVQNVSLTAGGVLTTMCIGVGTGTVTSISTSSPLTGGPITTTGTIGIQVANSSEAGYLNNVTAPLSLTKDGNLSISQATAASNGYLSSTDWNTFDNKSSTGNSASCPYGTANFTLLTGGNPSVTCAAQQGTGNGTSFINNVQSTDTFITVANGTTSNFSANLTTFDGRYRLNTGLVNTTNLTGTIDDNQMTNAKLNLTDQRYNETAAINSVNTSVQGLLTSNTTTNQRIDAVNATALVDINNISSLDKFITVSNITPSQNVNISLNQTTMAATYYNISQVNALIPQQTIYYFKNTTGFLGGTYNMSLVLPNNSNNENFTFASVTNNQLLLNFSSLNNTGFPKIDTGLVDFQISSKSTSGTQNTYLYFKLYIVNSTGGYNTLCTSPNSDVITSGIASDIVSCSVNQTVIVPGDSFYVEVYAATVGGGSAQTIMLFIDDNTTAGVSLPVPRVPFVEVDPLWTGNSTLVPYLASNNNFTANQNTTGNVTAAWLIGIHNFTNETGFPASAPTCPNGQFVQNASLSSGGVLVTVCQSPVITNNITGNGNANNLSVWTSASNLGSSPLYSNGTNVGLFTTTGTANFSVNGTLNASTIYQGANQVGGTGNSASCTYGVSNLTTVASGAPSVTCAAQQGTLTSVQSVDNYITVVNGTPSNISANLTTFDGRYASIGEPLWGNNSSLVAFKAKNETITGIWNYTSGVVLSGTGNQTIPPSGNLTIFANVVQGNTRPVYMDDDGLQITIGRDNFFIVRNTGAVNITKGQVVYVTGSTGSVPNVALAKANSLTTVLTLAVAMQDINVNAYGYGMYAGLLNMDTSAFVTGDELFLSATTAGGLVNVSPTYPNYVERIGTVTNSGVGNGQLAILIAPFIGGASTGTTNSFTVNGTMTATTVNGSVNTTNLTGTIAANQLANTAVSPSTYGGASTVGQFVVDAQGRITSATNLTIAIPYTNLTSIPTTFANWTNNTGASLPNTTTTNSTLQLWPPASGLPACNSTSRFSARWTAGAGGASDILWLCGKNNTDSYNWMVLQNMSIGGSG